MQLSVSNRSRVVGTQIWEIYFILKTYFKQNETYT